MTSEPEIERIEALPLEERPAAYRAVHDRLAVRLTAADEVASSTGEAGA